MNVYLCLSHFFAFFFLATSFFFALAALSAGFQALCLPPFLLASCSRCVCHGVCLCVCESIFKAECDTQKTA